MSVPTIKFRCDLYYGASKTRKTTNIGLAALYIKQKYGKRTRLVTADPGGYEPIQSLVDAGVIEPWVINQWAYPTEVVDKASQGYWPEDVNKVNSKLIPPATALSDNSGVGCLAFEGLSSIGTLMLDGLTNSGAQLSQDPSYKVKIGSTDYFGGNMTYYGFVQDKLTQFAVKSSLTPPTIEKVIWTALENRGEDKALKIAVFGPDLVGKAKTPKLGQMFGNLLHFEGIEQVGPIDPKTGQLTVKTDTVMYLSPHAEPMTKVMFPAGTRAPFIYAAELPAYMEADVGKLYRKLDELKLKADAWVTQQLSTTKETK